MAVRERQKTRCPMGEIRRAAPNVRCCAVWLACALMALGLFGVPKADAQIYRWRDAQGKLNFTSDLSKVPPEHRAAAARGAQNDTSGAEPSRLQTYSAPQSSGLSGAGPAPAAPGDAETWHVRVQSAGSSMMVSVQLNDGPSFPFLVDTGASDVLIPRAFAERLGLSFGEGTRTKVYQTANGSIEAPVVQLNSVSLGGARVEDVPASVSDSMSIGLLGLSYFNHFHYSIDAQQGLLTLRRNELARSGGIRGGRSEAQWRAEFANLRARFEGLDSLSERIPAELHVEQQRIVRERAKLEEELEQLELEADTAHVPASWKR